VQILKEIKSLKIVTADFRALNCALFVSAEFKEFSPNPHRASFFEPRIQAVAVPDAPHRLLTASGADGIGHSHFTPVALRVPDEH
jgi:hypothetical protein